MSASDGASFGEQGDERSERQQAPRPRRSNSASSQSAALPNATDIARANGAHVRPNARICPSASQLFSPPHHKIKTTRIAGGLLLGYNPWLARPAPQGAWPGRPSRPRALDARQPPEAADLRRYLANGSSYSLTLSLPSAWSEASCSRMYFAMVASFRPTVET